MDSRWLNGWIRPELNQSEGFVSQVSGAANSRWSGQTKMATTNKLGTYKKMRKSSNKQGRDECNKRLASCTVETNNFEYQQITPEGSG